MSLASGDPVYRYSGLLMGYVHLGNALYRADPDRWQVIRDTLPDTVVADLRQNSAYWAAFEGPVNDAASKVYDSFLKSNGESRGVQSYGHRGGYAHGVLRVSQVAVRGAANSPKAQEQAPSDGRGLSGIKLTV